MSSLRNNYRNIVNPVGVTVVRNLTDDGTGITGSKDILGDYSVTPKDFYIQPSGDQLWIIREVGGIINGVNNAALIDYGAIAGGLTNGLRFFLEVDGQEIEVTASSNHKNNADLLANGNRGYELEYAGQSKIDQFYLPTLIDTDTLVLDGAKNMKFILRANDNFTGLEAHSFYISADNKGAKGI
tara:strand:+ start:10663 stop:11214 length:552 start_codon:yes stop_codon:yes gene_type:complete